MESALRTRRYRTPGAPVTKPPALRIALVGVGKIARDQHLPTISGSGDVELVAAVDPVTTLGDVPTYRSLDEAFRRTPEIDAVILCTPPQERGALARAALRAGKHVLLEKPPAASIAEAEQLKTFAVGRGVTLYASWHSRFAAGVEPARRWLATQAVRSARILWKEDVRRWHPGRDWILAAGGMGVFDAGINALSILTRILPRPFALREATLDVPSNRGAPVAARLSFVDSGGCPLLAEFDFVHPGEEQWDIYIETDSASLRLSRGGAVLQIGGCEIPTAETGEYAALYAHFIDLVRAGRSDVDITPCVHVGNAFALGARHSVAPFYW
jgi:D-galactose 1-dehydrogenase